MSTIVPNTSDVAVSQYNRGAIHSQEEEMEARRQELTIWRTNPLSAAGFPGVTGSTWYEPPDRVGNSGTGQQDIPHFRTSHPHRPEQIIAPVYQYPIIHTPQLLNMKSLWSVIILILYNTHAEFTLYEIFVTH